MAPASQFSSADFENFSFSGVKGATKAEYEQNFEFLKNGKIAWKILLSHGRKLDFGHNG